MTDPVGTGDRPLPATRGAAIRLLQQVDFDLAQLSPEAIAAIRAAFHLPREGGP